MATEEIAHGRYIIRSFPLGTLWQARGFVDGRQVGDRHVADDRDAAVTSAKAALDTRDAALTSGKGADGSPSAIEYAEAFDRLGQLSPSYEAMLDAHLNAPDHCITATELAEAAGFENYNAANLHYGTLGQALANELNFNLPTRDDGTPISTCSLATDAKETHPQGHERSVRGRGPEFVWHLRPQVVEALTGRRTRNG